MTSYLEELSMTEAENVKRTIRDLFRQTWYFTGKIRPGHADSQGQSPV